MDGLTDSLRTATNILPNYFTFVFASAPHNHKSPVISHFGLSVMAIIPTTMGHKSQKQTENALAGAISPHPGAKFALIGALNV
ncbi:hypothetical protein T265_04865 [Opisthorchis viverrini]|uniref:Uncharacterized protein n=1 Tax=Opisthorchis viverrini TaxID=6198 RepID=A0A074ZLN1_OPIVI|nr:hypothetical protein T265_04865 [Opisthorchis viverrini]KER28263.1 hypothetical protein T265_04865 [Opisthorchis viverrini]